MSRTDTTPGRARVLAYLQLGRVPNVCTALADVMMGHVFVLGAFAPVPRFAALLAASAALYIAGMVLNDVFDVEVDRRERPQRPLPSGRVSLTVARRLGWGLLASGCLLAWLAGFLPPRDSAWPWLPGAIGTALALAIVSYDGWLKETWLGPFNMGLCRSLNVLLGLSAAAAAPAAEALGIWSAPQVCVAGGLGLYVAGITWFGRGEAETSRRWRLISGLGIMLAGWFVTAMFPSYLPHDAVLPIPNLEVWYLLLLLLSAPLWRRCLRAIQSPEPRQVQLAVKQGIWTIIWLDAAVVVAIGPPIYSLALVALFLPMLWLGRYVYAT